MMWPRRTTVSENIGPEVTSARRLRQTTGVADKANPVMVPLGARRFLDHGRKRKIIGARAIGGGDRKDSADARGAAPIFCLASVGTERCPGAFRFRVARSRARTRLALCPPRRRTPDRIL